MARMRWDGVGAFEEKVWRAFRSRRHARVLQTQTAMPRPQPSSQAQRDPGGSAGSFSSCVNGCPPENVQIIGSCFLFLKKKVKHCFSTFLLCIQVKASGSALLWNEISRPGCIPDGNVCGTLGPVLVRGARAGGNLKTQGSRAPTSCRCVVCAFVQTASFPPPQPGLHSLDSHYVAVPQAWPALPMKPSTAGQATAACPCSHSGQIGSSLTLDSAPAPAA